MVKKIKIFNNFEITKNFKNSFGVVMDDVIAGLYVVLVLIVSMVIKSYFSL